MSRWAVLDRAAGCGAIPPRVGRPRKFVAFVESVLQMCAGERAGPSCTLAAVAIRAVALWRPHAVDPDPRSLRVRLAGRRGIRTEHRACQGLAERRQRALPRELPLGVARTGRARGAGRRACLPE